MHRVKGKGFWRILLCRNFCEEILDYIVYAKQSVPDEERTSLYCDRLVNRSCDNSMLKIGNEK